jgi:hypothetical protein
MHVHARPTAAVLSAFELAGCPLAVDLWMQRTSDHAVNASMLRSAARQRQRSGSAYGGAEDAPSPRPTPPNSTAGAVVHALLRRNSQNTPLL